MVTVTGISLDDIHIKKLEAIQERFLRDGRMRRRNRSDVIRLLIEDVSLPDWSIDSDLSIDQTEQTPA